MPSATPWPQCRDPQVSACPGPLAFARLKISPAGQGIDVLHSRRFAAFWCVPACWEPLAPAKKHTLRSQVPKEVWRISRVSRLVKAPIIRGDWAPVIPKMGAETNYPDWHGANGGIRPSRALSWNKRELVASGRKLAGGGICRDDGQTLLISITERCCSACSVPWTPTSRLRVLVTK